MKISVLGVPYTLRYVAKAKDPGLEDCDGYCDTSTKTIVVRGVHGSRAQGPQPLERPGRLQAEMHPP